MKKFNLDEYLANPAMKVMTKDGRNARIICTDKRGNYPIVALVKSQTIDEEVAHSFTKDGCWSISSDKETINDLFFAPIKREGWVNVYRVTDSEVMSFGGVVYASREEAEKVGKLENYYVTSAKIEWEE